MNTIKKGTVRSIKEIKRKDNPTRFNFDNVEEETNQQTIRRVKAFIRESPSTVSKLADGSFYHGGKVDNKPAGSGFVAVFSDTDNTKVEQIYLGHFEKGKACKYGILIFDQGQGRYTGEWLDGKYHGKGLFKREWKSQIKKGKTESQFYDGFWMHGDMSGFGIFKWPSGNIFEGEWLANRRHGLGKITDSLGRLRKKGIWRTG